jgi:bifunctional DNase/RNase
MFIMVEVTVHGVYQQEKDSSTDTVVFLKVRDQERYLPIWISPNQATDVAIHLQGVTTQRPTTYVFMARLVERLGGQVDAVHITSLKESVYYASVRLKINDTLEEVDCRPSDALPLAMALGAPIFVDETVLEQGAFDGNSDGASASQTDDMGTLQPFEYKG